MSGAALTLLPSRFDGHGKAPAGNAALRPQPSPRRFRFCCALVYRFAKRLCRCLLLCAGGRFLCICYFNSWLPSPILLACRRYSPSQRSRSPRATSTPSSFSSSSGETSDLLLNYFFLWLILRTESICTWGMGSSVVRACCLMECLLGDCKEFPSMLVPPPVTG